MSNYLDGVSFERYKETAAIVLRNDLAKIGIVLLTIFVLMAVLGPTFAPHDPHERQVRDDGSWVRNEGPSQTYPLGTTNNAYPILSQLIYGARIAIFLGFVTALFVGILGTSAGIVAGYYGGWVENIIMRLVDVAYGVPFLPFIIVLVIVLDASIWNIIFAISVIAWRETARVIRSEVITIKELPMIDAAKASGASDRRILVSHVLPKVLPTTVLYSVFAIGWAILTEAGLSFLGFGESGIISWGRMLQTAYNSQALLQGQWYWIIPPGLAIMLLVLSMYFISQGVEEVVNPALRER